MVADHNARSTDIVQLSIGGTEFLSTTRATLAEGRAANSMLAAMFSGRHRVERDDEVRTKG